jgi:hypothetical protein
MRVTVITISGITGRLEKENHAALREVFKRRLGKIYCNFWNGYHDNFGS